MELHDHDKDTGKLMHCLFNEYNSLIITAAADGMIFVNSLCKNLKDIDEAPNFQELQDSIDLSEQLRAKEVEWKIASDQ